MNADSPAGAIAVVDSHVHVFSAEVIADRERVCAAEPWFDLLYSAPQAKLASPDDLLAAMDEAGVAIGVAAGFPWRDLGRARFENDFLAATAAASGGRIRWLANMPPLEGIRAAEEAHRCFALGASGIGEINADAQGVDLENPVHMAALAEACAAAGRPMMLHASEPVGHGYPGKGGATPARLLAFLEAHPTLDLVLAHWGGGLPFYELMPEVAAICGRVAYDSAASTYLYRPAVFRAVLDIVGPDRVLWGSDYPVLGMGRFLRKTVTGAGIRDDELPAVLSGTARRIYGIEGDEMA
jgi:predicted TIM-barrel fold metal-dependent hydrolase